eukprot:CAMPEP_0172786870 /NCGR_PEP_ID=MMETSP1074-20121228/206162_1 /TAXON_ID=2916 /ORGANISM="Ceratium fusus, Strain PA161109" /LENGTH=1640 /DNA_ID=CAMNT_0013623887 /DNA_START=56 /DNA_END=4979 /DNA_ORIENTATION=-
MTLPWRWMGICSAIGDNCNKRNRGDLRVVFCMEFCKTLFDVFCVPLGLLGVVVPTRTCAFFCDAKDVCDGYRKDSRPEHYNFTLRFLLLWVFFRAIADVFCLAVCLPSLVVPTRVVVFAWNLVRYHKSLRWHHDDLKDPKISLNLQWLLSPFIAFAEIVGFLSGLLTMLTFVRSCQTIDEVQELSSDRRKSPLTIEMGFHLEVHLILMNNAVLVLGTSFLLTIEMGFHLEVHLILMNNAVLVLRDIIFVPFILVLFLTGWRWLPVWTALRAGGFSWKVRRVVMRQFGRLVLDLTLAVPLLLIMLTWYRSSRFRAKFCQQCIEKRVHCPPSDVEIALLQDQMSFTSNVDEQEKIVTEVGGEQMQQRPENKSVLTSYHLVVLQCSSLLFLDVLCFPLVLMLTLTVYRFSAITGGLLGTQFHRAVLQQTGSMLLDVPFMCMGVLVICTLVRADLIWRCCCRTDAGTAWDRRRAAGWQLLFLLRDLAMLPALLVTVATLYRLPCLLMSLKVRMSRLMTEDAEMQALEFHMVMPRPKGHPGFYLRASKAPNLSGLVSMQMQLTGDAFWAAVAAAKGSMIASAGRAAFPFTLRDGLEVDLSAVQHGRPEAEITVEFQRNVKATTIEKFLGALPRDVEMLLQLEGKNGERRIVLLTLPLTVGQMLDALHAPDGRVAIAAQQRPETPAEGDTESDHINALRGAQVEPRDAWWSVVLAEFASITSDVAHLLMLLALLLVPWRFVLALWRCAGEPASQRAVRLASWTLAALRAWDEECDNVAAQIGPLTNTYAKSALVSSRMAVCSSARAGRRRHDNDRGIVEAVESVIGCCCCIFCPVCPNYNEYDTEDCEFMSRSRGRGTSTAVGSLSLHLKALNHPLGHACKELKRQRKAWPEELEFVVMDEVVNALLLSRAEYFFWLLLLPEVHILVNNFTGEEHARVSQMVRSRIFQVKKMHAEMQTGLATQFGIRCEEAKTSKKGRIKSKPMCESIIREELCEGLCNVKDILFGPILVVLLLVTIYRVPAVCALVRFPLDISRVKAKVKYEAYWLFIDIWRFCQTLLLSVLLLITVVKFPDFFSGLQPAKGILVARNWALFNAAELAVGILELLFLLTAWKTYRLLVAALVFMLLAPAAMLSVAFPTSMDRRLRFSIAGVSWCALLACALLLSAGTAVHASLLGLLLLAFLGFISNDVPGWVRPRGDMDWWSPSVRCSLPNGFALLGMATEASVLLAASMMLSSTPSELGLSLNSWQMLWHSTSAGLLAVAASLLLVSVPMVAEEKEQEMILADHAWRRSMQLLHEVCFLPVVLILAQACAASRSCSVALLYFTSLALLAGGVWDNSVSREELLDIRVVGLGSSGRQLMFCSAVFAAAGGHSMVFVLFGIAAVLWTAIWIPKGSSVPWVELFRIGLQVGALVAGFAGLHCAVGVWGATTLLATTVALVARRQRRQRIVSSDLPKAMEELVQIQARMKVWDDSVSCELTSLDVSEQGAAMQLLRLESELPFERLRPSFLEARRVLWQQELLNAKDYSDVLLKLKELKEAIHEPTTRILLKQVLRGIAVPGRMAPFPEPLTELMVGFTCAPMSVAKVDPGPGWEHGCFDLSALRTQAVQEAARLPLMFRTLARSHHGPTVFEQPSQVSMQGLPRVV